MRSFGLWYSVVSSILPHMDLTLLRRDRGNLLWLSWSEVSREIGNMVAAGNLESYHLMMAEHTEFLCAPSLNKQGVKTIKRRPTRLIR